MDAIRLTATTLVQNAPVMSRFLGCLQIIRFKTSLPSAYPGGGAGLIRVFAQRRIYVEKSTSRFFLRFSIFIDMIHARDSRPFRIHA